MFHLLSEELGHGAWVAGTGYSMGFRREFRAIGGRGVFHLRMVVGNGFFFYRGFDLMCFSLHRTELFFTSSFFFFTGLFVLSATFNSWLKAGDHRGLFLFLTGSYTSEFPESSSLLARLLPNYYSTLWSRA